MTYGECRDAALNLIHQESIAGEVIPGTYNNQQDYLNKIPSLINAAELDIATTVKRIPESVLLGELSYQQMGRNRIYQMPSDMWQLKSSGVLVPVSRPYDSSTMYRRVNQSKLLGRDRLILPADLPDDSILEYYRYPKEIRPGAADAAPLDNVPEAQAAIPYYVGAHLVLTDDAFLYSALYNTYESKKANMEELPFTEANVVDDAFATEYSPYSFWG